MKRGQALVEFGLTAAVLLIFVLAVIDWSWLFTTRAQAFQATRNAARFAATNPTAWDNSPNPSVTSIQGQLRLNPLPLSNDDSHITISYWLPGISSSETECGHYSAAQNSFIPTNGYSPATCLAPATSIHIQATYTYTYITPILQGISHSTDIATMAAVMEEVPCASC